MAQWLSWLERRPVTAEVESSSLFWVVYFQMKVNENLFAFQEYSSLAQSVEHAAVNRSVVGSSPTGGAWKEKNLIIKYGSVVKRLRHRPFTAVTRVRFP